MTTFDGRSTTNLRKKLLQVTGCVFDISEGWLPFCARGRYFPCQDQELRMFLNKLCHNRGFFRKNFQGGQTNVSRNRGGHTLELKYIMYFVASASLTYSSCLILHSVCAN